MNNSTTYARLSFFYLMYFAALGVFVPYWTVYLKKIAHFSPAQIGELMAVFMATKVIAPFLWGWLADHTGQRLHIIRWVSLLAMLCFAGVYWQTSFGWMLYVMAGFGFFWNASLPQFEALTLNHLGSDIGRYSQIRLWCSIGFIVMVIALPMWLGQDSIANILDVMMILFAGMWLSTWLLKDKPHEQTQQQDYSLWTVLRQPVVWTLLVACALQQASHGVYYNFFSIYLESYGYPRPFIGWMWALGVMAEVVLFIFMHRLIQRYGAERLFILALFVTGCRWLMLGNGADNLLVLLSAQILHAATYGLFHASAIHIIHHVFPGKLQGRGQALYSGVSYGLGGALGSLFSGYSWEAFGAEPTFYLATVTVNIGLFLSLYAMRGLRGAYVSL